MGGPSKRGKSAEKSIRNSNANHQMVESQQTVVSKSVSSKDSQEEEINTPITDKTPNKKKNGTEKPRKSTRGRGSKRNLKKELEIAESSKVQAKKSKKLNEATGSSESQNIQSTSESEQVDPKQPSEIDTELDYDDEVTFVETVASNTQPSPAKSEGSVVSNNHLPKTSSAENSEEEAAAKPQSDRKKNRKKRKRKARRKHKRGNEGG